MNCPMCKIYFITIMFVRIINVLFLIDFKMNQIFYVKRNLKNWKGGIYRLHMVLL